MEWRIKSIREAATLNQRTQPRFDARVFSIGELMLERDFSTKAIALYLIRRHFGGLLCAKRSTVHEGEVRHVKKIVGIERRTASHSEFG